MSSLNQTIETILQSSTAKLKHAQADSPRTDILVLLENVLGKDRSWLLAHPDYKLNSSEHRAFTSLLRRRINREPLAYVVGFKDFFGIKLKVNNTVLVPRPESEKIAEFVVENAPKYATVLDMGTGSGALAIAIKHERNDLAVEAIDYSEEILKIASSNSSIHNLDIKFIHSNLFENVNKKYDIVVANLPYVPDKSDLEPELTFEPRSSLFSGRDGLDIYRGFLAELSNFLTKDGYCLIEHDPLQLKELRQLATKNGFLFKTLGQFVSKLNLE